MEIQGNYPENIMIDAEEKCAGGWNVFMYMTREKQIHKLMLSTSGAPFKSKVEAIDYMTRIAEKSMNINLTNNNENTKEI